MERTVKTAGVQLASTGERDGNLRRAAELVAIAAEKGAKIVCLPQLFANHWFPAKIEKGPLGLAEPEGGPTITAMKEAAQKNEVVLIAPVFELDPNGGDRYSSAFVLGPDGETIGKYRKVHVPQIPLWEERSYFKPGDLGFPVFDTPHGRIGVQLCWDIFFPEGFRALALAGAEIVFIPTASAFHHARAKWERAAAAAAHSNGLFIWRVNRVGKEESQDFYGESFCVRPDGEYAVSPGGRGEGIILAELDLSDVARTRNDWVFLKDRRPSEYGLLVEEEG